MTHLVQTLTAVISFKTHFVDNLFDENDLHSSGHAQKIRTAQANVAQQIGMENLSAREKARLKRKNKLETRRGTQTIVQEASGTEVKENRALLRSLELRADILGELESSFTLIYGSIRGQEKGNIIITISVISSL